MEVFDMCWEELLVLPAIFRSYGVCVSKIDYEWLCSRDLLKILFL